MNFDPNSEHTEAARLLSLGFNPPPGYRWLLERGWVGFDPITVLQPWHYLDEQTAFWVNQRRPAGAVFAFARRQDCDDLACFEMREDGAVGIVVIRVWTPEGCNIVARYPNFWDWLKAVVDEGRMIPAAHGVPGPPCGLASRLRVKDCLGRHFGGRNAKKNLGESCFELCALAFPRGARNVENVYTNRRHFDTAQTRGRPKHHHQMTLMKDLHENARSVATREDFVRFVALMVDDLKANPQAWENRDLAAFLQALGSWVEDMDGYYQNRKIDPPKSIDWKFMSDVLMAARIYE